MVDRGRMVTIAADRGGAAWAGLAGSGQVWPTTQVRDAEVGALSTGNGHVRAATDPTFGA